MAYILLAALLIYLTGFVNGFISGKLFVLNELKLMVAKVAPKVKPSDLYPPRD